MRKFKVNVNGVAYNVEVAEEGVVAVAAPAAAPVAAAAPAPVAEAPKAPAPVAAAGDTTMNAPMPGSVSKIVAREGQVVKKGDVIIMLEAMKMQNEIMSPADGTVSDVRVTAGQNVKTGEAMVVL